jgi:lactoylglutathione lyase
MVASMRNTFSLLALLSVLVLSLSATTAPQEEASQQDPSMKLGNFSVSLAVKDIKASRDFYQKLDFHEVGGNIEHNWLVLQNGSTTVGLFQGMFEDNLMTFNPGWDKDKNTLKEFDDVRAIQTKLKDRGIKPVTEADVDSQGPASFVVMDPDGNTILFDQHVNHPAKIAAEAEKE